MVFFTPIRTYQGLRQIVIAFATPGGTLTFVVIVGNPGLGKTNTFRRMCNDAFVLECNTTPFGLYTALYEHRDAELIVLDDVDTLMSTPTGLNLLKALCQTDRVKRVSWNTAAADRAEIPRSFDLKARVLIFANEINGHGKNFAAVLDRGHCYSFEPTAQEVHAEVHGWIERKESTTVIDSEVFDFIGEHLAEIPVPTFRDYVKATEQKAAGLDWRSGLEARWQSDPKLSAVAEIMRLYESGDPALKTADQRAGRFAEWGHGVRSTYMLYQKRLLAARGVARLPKSGRERGVPKKVVSATQTVNPSDFRTLTPTDPNVQMINECDFHTGGTTSRPEAPGEAKTRVRRETDIRKKNALREIKCAMAKEVNAAVDKAVELAQQTNTVAHGVVNPYIHLDVTVRKDRWFRTERYTLYDLYTCDIMTPGGTAVPTCRIKKRKASMKVDVPVVIDKKLP